ncbi:NUDIX hydrolase [Enterococcus olivae]
MDYLATYKRLLSIAQAGLTYGKDPFDQERYTDLKQIALQLIQTLGNEPTEKIQELFSQETGYQTPKVDVRALIVKGDQILLVQDTQTKDWALPGGYAEVGLTPRENIAKEVLEETGLTVDVSKLLTIFDTNLRKDIPQTFQYYKLVFACEVLSKETAFEENIETSQAAYFDMDHLPKLSVKRTTVEQLNQLLELQNDCYVE